ncbi:IS200/IS605 family transposase [Yersinia pestis]|uniref:IS200/IS605 family transposase n=1 Tax=Yersinia pestis TaxID=632 RepID=UPI00402B1946
MRDEKSLAHTRWNCKYHIVFAPKCQRRMTGDLYRKTQSDWQYFKKTVRMEKREYPGSRILCGSLHMLLEIPPKMSVSGFMGYLKGKSSLMLYEQFGDLKFKYRNREFWCRGYYVDTVGKNTARIQEYIKHQLEEDKMGEQLSIPYPGSPFTGRK